MLLAARAGRAQTTGSIEGRLSDSEGGALPGVSVSATSPSLQGTRTAIADRTGLFRIPAVPPGEYTVRAALPGFRQAEKTATVRLDGTASVDFVLEPLQTEAIVVSGEAPAIDQASTTTGTSYTSSVIAALPVSRNYADIVKSNPGVSIDRGATDGRSLALAIYGATSAENQWIIDGVNTTNPFQGIQGKAINNEFVQEVEVKTGGYQPEYGRALGGVINVITKSGGNVYHGDAFAYYDSTGTVAEQEFNPGDIALQEMRADGSRFDYGADLGGYIVKDRLWFFAAYNRVEVRQDLSRFESSTYVSSEDLFPFDSTENLYSGKLTWNIASSTTLVGTVFADPSTSAGASGAPPVSPEPSTWYSARDLGGTDFGVRLNRLFGSQVLATLQGSYHQDQYALTAPDGIRYEDWTCDGRNPGGTVRASRRAQQHHRRLRVHRGPRGSQPVQPAAVSRRRHALRGRTTSSRPAGTTAWAALKRSRLSPGGQSVEISNEFGQLYYMHIFFAVSPDDPTPVPHLLRNAAVRDFGVYLQDSWKAAPGLTINAGLRWDGEDIHRLRRRDGPSACGPGSPGSAWSGTRGETARRRSTPSPDASPTRLPTDMAAICSWTHGPHRPSTSIRSVSIPDDGRREGSRVVLRGRTGRRAGRFRTSSTLIPGRADGGCREVVRVEAWTRRIEGHLPAPRRRDREPLRFRLQQPGDRPQRVRDHHAGLRRKVRARRRSDLQRARSTDWYACG